MKWIIAGIFFACVFLAVKYPYIFPFLFSSPLILVRRHRYKRLRPFNLFGVFGYFGDVGSGKTLSVARELHTLRKKYGDKIFITTNFGHVDEDIAFSSWEDLVTFRENVQKPIVCGFDEMGIYFRSRDFSSFPPAFNELLVQNRKGYGFRLLYTSQYNDQNDKVIREISNEMADCFTLCDVFTVNRIYTRRQYKDKDKKSDQGVSKKTKCFVHSDELYSLYDSFLFVKNRKNHEQK